MRCPWCHNPETIRTAPEVVWHSGRCLGDRGCINQCPSEALKIGTGRVMIDRKRCRGCGRCIEFCPSEALEIHGRTIPVLTLFEEAARDLAFYRSSGGGVTLSGGEPLAQPEAAIELLRLSREAGIHTALDTCGAVTDRALDQALQFTDLVLFDVKITDPARHEAFTGVAFERIAMAARRINESGVPVWVRTPVIPGYTDNEADIQGVAQFVQSTFMHCERHDLLAFSNLCRNKYELLDRPFVLDGVPLLTADRMEHLREVAAHAGSPNVHWSGPTKVETRAETNHESFTGAKTRT